MFCESELVYLEIEVDVRIIHEKYGQVNEGFMRCFLLGQPDLNFNNNGVTYLLV